MSENLIIRQLGLQPYKHVLYAMHNFTNQRTAFSNDEIWLVQHPQIFTQGHASKDTNLLIPGNIPVVQSDRGGQITFHGPGQQIMYVLIDIYRRKLRVRDLVTLLEQMVVTSLSYFNINAHTRDNAPGVYVDTDKICSIGLRIRKGYSFHGLALNISMDLTPFLRINPCGYVGLRMTQVSDLVSDVGINEVVPILLVECLRLLNSTTSNIQSWNMTQYYR